MTTVGPEHEIPALSDSAYDLLRRIYLGTLEWCYRAGEAFYRLDGEKGVDITAFNEIRRHGLLEPRIPISPKGGVEVCTKMELSDKGRAVAIAPRPPDGDPPYHPH